MTSVIDAKKITAWGESGFPARFLDQVGAGAQPSVTVRNGKVGQFRVVPAGPELVDALRSVSHRSPSDKNFTGRGDQAIVPQAHYATQQRSLHFCMTSRISDWFGQKQK